MRDIITKLDLEKNVLDGVHRSAFGDKLKASIFQGVAFELRKIADEVDALAKEMRDA